MKEYYWNEKKDYGSAGLLSDKEILENYYYDLKAWDMAMGRFMAYQMNQIEESEKHLDKILDGKTYHEFLQERFNEEGESLNVLTEGPEENGKDI